LIAIDTNVLLRYLLQDDKAQATKAQKLITNTDTVLVSDVVLAETVWTLTGKKYKLGGDEIVQVLLALFEEPTIVFQDSITVWRALSEFRLVQAVRPESVGFPDTLILHVGRAKAAQSGDSFDGFYTFDLAAQNLHGAKAP